MHMLRVTFLFDMLQMFCRIYTESDVQTSKLYITSIQSDDEGTFTCTADGLATQLNKSIQLLLFSKHCHPAQFDYYLTDYVCMCHSPAWYTPCSAVCQCAYYRSLHLVAMP